MEKEDINLVDKNIKQFDFWSQNPCGTDGNLYKVMQGTENYTNRI